MSRIPALVCIQNTVATACNIQNTVATASGLPKDLVVFYFFTWSMWFSCSSEKLVGFSSSRPTFYFGPDQIWIDNHSFEHSYVYL